MGHRFTLATFANRQPDGSLKPVSFETATALCEACGHIAEVRVRDLWRRSPSYKRIAEIRLWQSW
jgi:hypothetical protein